MKVSSIQRMGAVIIMVAVIFWFYRKQFDRFNSGFPLISVAQTEGLSLDLHSDALFCEKILQMKLLSETDSSLIFMEGLILNRNRQDTLSSNYLSLRTRRLTDIWNDILSSPVLIIHPPALKNEYYSAKFKLPGGQVVQLVEY